MSGSNRIPSNVDEKAASLLERAYTLKGDTDTHELYRDWAETYDNTMLDGLGYLSPRIVSAMFAEHMHDRSGLVLDIGCGTGLAGAELARVGFNRLDGMDYSAEMLQVAGRRGVYNCLIEADLNKPLTIATATYDGALCTGTFTHGHVGPDCLIELFRTIKPGGIFAFSVNAGVWSDMEFDVALKQLVTAGTIELVEHRQGVNFQTSSTPDSMLNVYRRT